MSDVTPLELVTVSEMLARAERIERQRRLDEQRLVRKGSGTFRRVQRLAVPDGWSEVPY